MALLKRRKTFGVARGPRPSTLLKQEQQKIMDDQKKEAESKVIKEYNHNPANNQFKDIKGCWRVHSLFYEWNITDYVSLFTIHNEDRIENGIPYRSLYKIYMSYSHVPGSEYEFATKELGGWEHWLRLCSAGKNIVELIQQWRDELEVRIRAGAIKSMMTNALEPTAVGANAAKWLAEKGYAPKRGRPSKEERQAHLKREESINKQIEADLERVGLSVVSNG